MAKELTNRQLSEILGYALERAEKNISQSVEALESERKRIENFKVDTESADRIFKEADKRFKDTLSGSISEFKRLQEEKPKWLQIKDWILIGALSLLVLLNGGLAIRFYYKQSQLEETNAKLTNIVDNLSDFFGEHPKERKVFEEWNKKHQLR